MGKERRPTPAPRRAKPRASRPDGAGRIAAEGGLDAAPLIALLERVARHDADALARLYDATVGRIYGACLRIARKPEAAEEIVGDVYLQVWKNAATYSAERGHPLAWLMVMARSRALDHLRRADPAESHAEPESLADYALAEDDPHNLLEAARSNAAVHHALATLAPIQRQLLALAFFQGMTQSEIAEHAQLPLGTVKTHVRRALAALRAVLGEPE